MASTFRSSRFSWCSCGCHELFDHVRGDEIEQQAAILVEAQVEDVPRPRQVDFDDLLDPAGRGAHHHHPVGEINRFLDVVRHEDHGLLRPLDDIVKVVLDLAARMLVERREGFVCEQDIWCVRERADDRDPVTHAARELVRIVIAEFGQIDHREEFFGAARCLRKVCAADFGAEHQVFPDRQPRKQVRILEDHATARIGCGDRNAVFGDRPGCCLLEARDDVEERGLAAAGRADQQRDLAFIELHVDTIERSRLPAIGATILLGDVMSFYNWFPDSSCAQASFLRAMMTMMRSLINPKMPSMIMPPSTISMRMNSYPRQST